jgi:hypothetical protein
VREANRQYEFNYNGEVDNGMLIGAALTSENATAQNHTRDSQNKKQPL